jgi:type II secretory ATPase GspE/PulE/Tfp pilus assembly ATPase PilB-like protein
VLPVDVEASELITSGATAHQVEESVRKRHGLTSLREQGLEMLWSGESDLASIKDVINLGY